MAYSRLKSLLLIPAAFIAGALLWAGCKERFPDVSDEPGLGRHRAGFVDTRGADFVLDGRRIHFAGANIGGIQSLWSVESRDMAANAEATVRAAAECCNLLRVWAFGDGSDRDPTPFEALMSFRMGPERRQSNPYLVLDHVLAAARRHKVHVTLVFANFWPDYGGIRRYYEWFNQPPAPPYTHPDEDTPTLEQARFFFTDERARHAYRSHVRSIIQRVNSVTGVRYSDDPTIMSYELMNEIRIVPGLEQEQYEWAHEMSKFIKTLDPYHLVSNGFDKPHTSLMSWVVAGRLPNVDYLDVHLYPEAAPSAHNPAHDWSSLWGYLIRNSEAARTQARKPVILSEFNFPRSSYAAFGLSTDEAGRMGVSEVMAQSIRELDYAGALFWSFSVLRTEGEFWVNPSVPRDAALLREIDALRDQVARSH